MATRLLPVLFAVVAACMAQVCPNQQPTVIQMTCGNVGPSNPPPPHVVHPTPSAQPPHVVYSTPSSQPPMQQDTTTTENTVSQHPSSTLNVSSLPLTQPRECGASHELAIVIDSSSSVGADNYKILLRFAAWLAWRQITNQKWIRVSAFIYSDHGSQILSLAEFDKLNHGTLPWEIEAFNNAPYLSGGNSIEKGLQDGAYELMSFGRPNIAKNVILLTGGASKVPSLTKVTANNLQNMGIGVISVGIGSHIDNQELLEISKNQDYIFHSDQFDQVLNLLKPVSSKLCQVVDDEIRNQNLDMFAPGR